MLITALATCRLSPTLPLSVERNNRQAGSCLKRLISARRRFCGTDPVCQAASTPISAASSRTIVSMRSHSEKTMTLRSGSSKKVGQDALELLELGADAAGRIEDGRRVADHAHAGEQLLQTLEFGLRQRALLRLGDEPRRGCVIVLVAKLLLLGHRDEECLDGAARQLRLDVRLAPAQHQRTHALAQLGRGSCSRSGGRARRAR